MSGNEFREEDFDGRFAKSTFSDGAGDCVEVAWLDGWIAVRDSKDLLSPMLWFTLSEWLAFLAGVRAGEFDFGE
ncbi:DUF397 domain-containing protein [Nocardia blacklockiae]|uniref:DUF397 domain-containing protein n=1 Tax=Nocardia blacklockiae TaxID=480036 RepID=UPI001895FDD4|nr:DUF397 domain-containing protein [Nocardia blacklockiae]MBF6175694.1 DUF397 domain-containing protein [Nocardia blacklockiae]